MEEEEGRRNIHKYKTLLKDSKWLETLDSYIAMHVNSSHTLSVEVGSDSCRALQSHCLVPQVDGRAVKLL